MFNALAAGQKVYGQGSYAPTRGRVSAEGAQGYLKREITKNAGNRNIFGGVSRVGRDGNSDTRSGVAANALRNRLNTGQRPGNGGRPVTTPSKPKTPDGTGGPGPVYTGPPPVKINKDGVLELPYNQEVSQGILQAQQDMNSQLMELNSAQQQQGLQFGQNMRQTDLDYGNLQRATLNDSAGRGTIFSSGYGQAFGNDANAYNTQKNDLLAQNSLFNTETDRQRLGIETAFNNMLAQFALDQANAASENAGTLGFGTNKKNNEGPNLGPGNHQHDKHKKRPDKPKRRPQKKGGKRK